MNHNAHYGFSDGETISGRVIAVPSFLGFGSGFLAPLAFGLAFALLALGAVVGLPIVQRMGLN